MTAGDSEGAGTEVIDADLPICDAHHHLWSKADGTYLASNILDDMATGHHLTHTVFVEWKSNYRTDGPQAMRPVGEVAFAAEANSVDARLCAAIVGFADLTLGANVDAVLEAQIEAGDGRFRGLRYVACWDEDPLVGASSPYGGTGAYADPKFREGFARLKTYGLTFDAWAYQTQLSDVTDLAASFPEQPIVMNHTGGPLGVGRYSTNSTDLFTTWRNGIRDLSRQSNVTMKLGGLGMSRTGLALDKTRPSWMSAAEKWGPWIAECIDAFGPSRCMFESNFPVDRSVISYHDLWCAFKSISKGLSETEKRAVFVETACRFYGIETTASLA